MSNKKGNILLKISLIVLAIVLAVGAVLVFMKTRIQPPINIVMENQFTENLHQLTYQLQNSSDDLLEADYQLLKERIDIMHRENLISDSERDASHAEFVNEYARVFRIWCDHRFMASVWQNADVQFMRVRIKELQQNATEINSENETKLDEVSKVLTDYTEAWKLDKVNIHSSSDSRQYLNKANRYKQDSYLSHCDALMNFLNGLKPKYQSKHYAYVNAMVKKLSNSNYELSEISMWAGDYKSAKTAVQDYNNAASSLYGVSSNTFNLSNYYESAKTGFKQRILRMSQWDNGYYTAKSAYRETFNVSI